MPARKKAELKPSDKQVAFVEMYMTTNKKVAQIAHDLGIPTSTADGWMKNNRFVTWMNTLRSPLMKSLLPKVDLAVIAKAMDGDMVAAKLVYERWDEMRERETPSLNITFEVGGNGDRPSAKVVKEAMGVFSPN